MNSANLRAIDLNLLVVFQAMMTERSVSKAAVKLHLTQSAVSQALGRLRALLADPLFVRAPSGMHPTAFAERIAGRVATALRDVADIFTSPDLFDTTRSARRFSVGMTDLMAFILMPDLLQRLEKLAPDVELVIRPVNRIAGLTMIERGDLELLVAGLLKSPPSYLSSSRLMAVRFLCAGRRDHPAFRKRLTTDSYLSSSHLDVSPWDELGYIDKVLNHHHVIRHIRVTIGHFLLAPPIVEQSDLIVTMPQQILVPMAQRYALALRPPPFDFGEIDIAQHWHSRLEHDSGLVWLRQQIAAVAEATSLPGLKTTAKSPVSAARPSRGNP